MADEPMSVCVEQPLNHAGTLTRLKSKLSGEGDQRASPAPTSSKLQCPKVPKKLLPDVKGQDCNVPQRMSLGPYHHGLPRLAKGETLKLKFAKAFITEWNLRVDGIYSSICNQVRELKGCYEEETAEKFSDAEFTEMMLVDGCALLWYIICVCVGLGHEDYDIGYQDLSLLHQDVLLLENQLPYQLLQQLMELLHLSSNFWTLLFQEFFGMMEESFFQELKEKPLLHRMKDFCCQLFLSLIRSIKGNLEPKPNEELKPKPEEESQTKREEELQPKPEEESKTKPEEESEPKLEDESQPRPEKESKPRPEEESKPRPEDESKRCHHLLDLYRRNFLGDAERSRKGRHRKDDTSVIDVKEAKVPDIKEQLMASFRNVKDLMAAGIRIKPSPTRYLRDISFTSNCITNGITAYLQLPPITIDKSTKTLFFNLIAYEMSSDVPHDFISYLRFLDSLIDHADDVNELQSAGVLQNNLGTHEEVADFFNTVSAQLDSNFYAYKDVRVKIRKHLKSHYNSNLKMWMTQCLDTYLSSPWTIIAWIAAALALFLTAVQTYFSAFSR